MVAATPSTKTERTMDPTLPGSKFCLLEIGVGRLWVAAIPSAKAGRTKNPTLPIHKFSCRWYGLQGCMLLPPLAPRLGGQRKKHCLDINPLVGNGGYKPVGCCHSWCQVKETNWKPLLIETFQSRLYCLQIKSLMMKPKIPAVRQFLGYLLTL